MSPFTFGVITVPSGDNFGIFAPPWAESDALLLCVDVFASGPASVDFTLRDTAGDPWWTQVDTIVTDTAYPWRGFQLVPSGGSVHLDNTGGTGAVTCRASGLILGARGPI
jgi:hypothetical protein